MKKEFVLRKKVYPLSRKEWEEMCEFIMEQLRKGYIRPSKLSQMALVFFVRKKNRKKWIIQHYRYLNKWTVKNNYLSPFILDIVENIGTKKVFTKMDLQWGYNNIWIKEGDEWKTTFTTPEGLFKPTVIFFRLMNLSAMFQTIMNEVLQDLINTGKMAIFIDDMIIGTEGVVRRLVENDLYVKSEKCK